MVIGIDPGQTTGISVIAQRHKIYSAQVKYQNDMDDYVGEVIHTCSLLADLSKSLVFIEGFRFYNAAVSIIAATTGKLDIIIRGSILINERIRKLVRGSFIICPSWKGTMNDELVKARVESVVERKGFEIVNSNTLSCHQYDAIGLALHGLSLFNEN